MSEPVFVRTAYTGQPETADENVACPVCSDLTNLRWAAWFDPFNKSFGPGGCYVCYRCLSAERKAEIAASHEALTYPPLSN
jgi:hypothetical protein